MLTWTQLELQCTVRRLETRLRLHIGGCSKTGTAVARHRTATRSSSEFLAWERNTSQPPAAFEVPYEASEPRSCGCWQAREELPVFSCAGRCTSANTSRKGASSQRQQLISWSCRLVCEEWLLSCGPSEAKGLWVPGRAPAGVKSQDLRANAPCLSCS